MRTREAETSAGEPIDLPSNWGRWGDDDERGTLNLITEEVRARAAAEVRSGRAVSLAVPIQPTPFISGPFAPSTSDASPVQQAMVFTAYPTTAAADVLVVTNHHPCSTHLDALGHVFVGDQVYPGRPVSESMSQAGAHHGSTTAFAAGVLTRGVLLDLAPNSQLPDGHPVTPDDFDAAEDRQGVHLEPGDALIVRGGWPPASAIGQQRPGMTLDAVRWMHRRGVSLYAGDIGDAHPELDPALPAPLHEVGLARMGMPLIDAAHVDDLAAVCAELRRHSFLLAVAPPRVHGLTGVPVNPLAIF
ncbi:cyclase family protein [Goodfellowiella coeruleoviolacea]|uniref:Kynurenine formamidase n=1 Tax=Goodfellowiella coeruleoviolacea TaxID=334858 RepID=A0AAE3GJ46_9PSEU|nr:cyclase family protein [Goodfellowiella coeruleoviolacea]MCP2168264.1 Kynurenine formamidase [Goodfellowiella coeruleoviolacea]